MTSSFFAVADQMACFGEYSTAKVHPQKRCLELWSVTLTHYCRLITHCIC